MLRRSGGNMTLKGRAWRGELDDNLTNVKSELEFATVQPIGESRIGLDVLNSGLFYLSQANNPEAGTTLRNITLTAHGARRGDHIRFTTFAGGTDFEIAIKEITDVDNFLLEGNLSAIPAVSDVFDILRPVTQRLGTDGATLAGPIEIQKGAGGVYTSQAITKDTSVIANTVAMPVEIVGVAGTEINVTAGDINVQLSHVTANPDSTQIGDGVEILQITPAGEANVQVNGGNVADNAADSGSPVKVGARYNLTPQVYADGDRSDLQSDVNGNLKVADINISTTPGTFAEDTANADGQLGYHLLTVRQDVIASSTSTDGDYGSVKASTDGAVYVHDSVSRTSLASIAAEDFATEVTLAAINAKFGTLGQKAAAGSAPVVIASDQTAIPITAASLPLPTGAATEATLASLAGEDFATQTTLAAIAALDFAEETTQAAMSLKLPATLGQKTSALSMAVVLPSDQQVAIQQLVVIERAVFDFAGTTVSTAYQQLVAALSAEVKAIQIFTSTGTVIELATGAAAAEVVQLLVSPGGFPGHIMPVSLANGARVAIRKFTFGTSSNADATAGFMLVNFLG
jgi:hypothetical protein